MSQAVHPQSLARQPRLIDVKQDLINYKMSKREYRFETLQVRAGQEIDPQSKGTAVPIYQSTAYVFDNMQDGVDLFTLSKPGNIYTRITNTTTEVFEKRMAALENGVAATATASGQSAVLLSIMNIAGKGDNIVTSPFLYGGTFTMFAITLRDMGIDMRFAKSDRVEDLEALVDGNTKAVYVENLANPAFSIPDFEPIVEMAHRHGICVLVDNTFGMGGYIFRPSDWGVNVSIHSATKWICGHGTALGGVVIDNGNFDWTPEKYPLLAAPSESYHGVVYTEVFGKAAFAGRIRVDGLRNLGPAPSPFNSFLMLQGLETLSLRGQRCCDNALEVAQFLEKHPAVSSVNYTGLESNPYHGLGKKYLRHGFGGVLTFRVKGGFESAAALVDKLELILHVGSVGDSKSLIVHPASTTHSQLSPQEQVAAGVYPDQLRLSVGIENADDLIYDLKTALEK